MVGSPKHLSDLDRIEADVRITCRRCGFEDDWTTADLARYLFEIGGSTVWSEITRYLTCRRFGCGSPELWALPVPFARRPANMKRRVGALDARTIDVALRILQAAASMQSGGSTATLEVRLALLVLYRFTRDREAVRKFWERASIVQPTVNDGLQDPLAAIRERLVERGWLGPDLLLERVHTWPWSSPAPRGWRASPACPEHEPENDNS
jgi:hypothetical protein